MSEQNKVYFDCATFLPSLRRSPQFQQLLNESSEIRYLQNEKQNLWFQSVYFLFTKQLRFLLLYYGRLQLGYGRPGGGSNGYNDYNDYKRWVHIANTISWTASLCNNELYICNDLIMHLTTTSAMISICTVVRLRMVTTFLAYTVVDKAK